MVTARLRDLAAQLFNLRGIERFTKKRYAEAVADFTAAAKLDSALAQAQFNLGFAQALLGQKSEAAATMRKALASDPEKATRAPDAWLCGGS